MKSISVGSKADAKHVGVPGEATMPPMVRRNGAALSSTGDIFQSAIMMKGIPKVLRAAAAVSRKARFPSKFQIFLDIKYRTTMMKLPMKRLEALQNPILGPKGSRTPTISNVAGAIGNPSRTAKATPAEADRPCP